MKFGPPTPKKMRTVSPTLACSGCSFESAPTEPLKTKYSGRSFKQLLDAELLAAVLPVGRIGVDLALHDVELVVDRRQAPSGSTRIRPYMPLAMCSATIGVAQ